MHSSILIAIIAKKLLMLTVVRCSREVFDGRRDEIMRIFDCARAFMRSYGNAGQWINGYPSAEVIAADVDGGNFYLVMDGSRIVACFCFRPSPEPNYSLIVNGSWPDDRPYHVIHRLASDGSVKGIGRFVFNWCMDRCDSIRVDTHADNIVMHRLLASLGYSVCGTIYVEDGSERTAYSWGRLASSC